MPTLSSTYSFIHVWNEPIFWDYEYINWTTVENQLYGIYTFVGSGIVDGWEVTSVSEDEVEDLSDDIKNSLEHTSYCMMFQVSAGDGIIGVYAAYTPDITYKAIPILKESKKYYVYAVATDCLPTKHRADILLTTDSTYDSTHTATYLSTIITYYDSSLDETYIYRIYDENNRRRILKNLQGPALEAIKEKFYRHKHIGYPDTEFQVAIPDNPSKIALGSEVIEDLVVVSSSTIFLIENTFLLRSDLTGEDQIENIDVDNYPIYEKADVKLNGVILTDIIDYYLDNINGKLYLKNNVKTGDTLQIVKYLNPSDGQIARGPQDDPASAITGTIVTATDIFTVNDDYKLPKNRVGDIDASKIVFGTFPIDMIQPINHYGMKRIRESAVIDPKTLTRTKDQKTYYLVPPDKEIGYDTEVITSFNSKFIGTVISTPSGLYKVNDSDYQDLTKIDFNNDIGIVIKIYDNNIEGDHDGDSKFLETYILTNLGQVWYTSDAGVTWDELKLPSYENLFVNCFTVSTDKVERTIKNIKTYDYYKIYNLGTNQGLFKAKILAAKGTISGGTENIITTVIPWVYSMADEITSLQEVITGHSRVTESDSSYWYDRSLYIGTENGFYANNRLVTNSQNIVAEDILWVFDNTALLVSDDEKLYITHTFSHIQTDDGTVAEDFWKHPLTEINEELHISYNFVNKFINKLSQESGRRKYFAGLDEDIAISSLDSRVTDYGISMPFLNGSIKINSLYGINSLNNIIDVSNLCGANNLESSINILSLDYIANHLTMTDAEKEIADGWNPLTWYIPNTYMEDTQSVLFTDKSVVEYSTNYGNQQPTDYYVSSSNGIWKSSDGGSIWQRPVLIWDTDVIPYVERNGDYVISSEYNLNHSLQAIIFKNIQKTSDFIMVEKDFLEYFAVNGKWEQDTADLAVYINDELSTIPYVYDKDLGKFTFVDKLTKTSNVTFSLIDIGTYITDIGIIPHSEVLDAFVESSTVGTELATELLKEDTNIKVLDTTNFPNTPHYIKIGDEKIYVSKYDKYTFKVIKQRNGSLEYPVGESVKLIEIKRQYGIEDYISIETSGQTYNIFSLYVANLLRGQMSLKRVYENIFDNIPHYPPVSGNSTTIQGINKSLINIGDFDELDDASSVSTLWNGLDIPSRSSVATPRIINYIYDPGNTNFTVGSEKGVWRYDGTKWSQLSKLNGASIVYYVNYDRRGYLIAGTNNGLWISTDDGVTWALNTILYNEQLSFLTGTLSWWSPSKKYELYGKNDGLSMVVYGWDTDSSESFHSDHFDPIDGKKVYGFFQGTFYRIDENTGQKNTYDSIWVMSEEGLYLCYNGTRYLKDGVTINPYSAILKGVEPVDPGYRTETTESSTTGEEVTTVVSGTEGDLSKDQRYIKTGIDSNNEPIYEKLKFYGAFQDSRPKTVPVIFLTNDGLRISRNWHWVDPENLSIYLFWEATPLSINNIDINNNSDDDKRITCNCYATGTDNTISDTSQDIWEKYKCFIGTNKGIYRSYNGCYTLDPCQRISNVSSIYSLVYNDNLNRLYAGTDNGLWYSDNDGDDWTKPISDINNVSYIDNNNVAQTFIPAYNEITKVGLYLHPKEL